MTYDSRLEAQRAGFAAHFQTLDPIDRLFLLDSLDIALAGGCGLCDTEHGHMCAGCGRCRCYDHDECTRPAETVTR